MDLKLLRKSTVKVSSLHCQHIPWLFDSKIWHGDDPMLIQNSPHVRFLRVYEKVGDNRQKLLETDYAEMYRDWDRKGFRRFNKKPRDDKYINFKISRIISVYEAIKRKGFSHKYPIDVLETPFWKTRYGHDAGFLQGREIWHGHHRAASSFCLEIDRVPCLFYKDAHPGAKRCRKFDKRHKD